jgi:hypothetical protein
MKKLLILSIILMFIAPVAKAQFILTWESPAAITIADTTIQVSEDSLLQYQLKVNNTTLDTFLVTLVWIETAGREFRSVHAEPVNNHAWIAWYDQIAVQVARKLNIKP